MISSKRRDGLNLLSREQVLSKAEAGSGDLAVNLEEQARETHLSLNKESIWYLLVALGAFKKPVQ